MSDLWPDDIGNTTMTPPIRILKEQASYLIQKTQNIVEAEVKTNNHNQDFVHTFYLVAPVLDNYRCQLFRIQHGIVRGILSNFMMVLQKIIGLLSMMKKI